MHLKAEMLRGMTYGQRVLMEHLNTQVMILECQLATASEKCGSDCKKEPNIRYTLRAEALELHALLKQLEGERDQAYSELHRVMDAMKNLVAHLTQMRWKLEQIDGGYSLAYVKKKLTPELRLLLELMHIANQFR